MVVEEKEGENGTSETEAGAQRLLSSESQLSPLVLSSTTSVSDMSFWRHRYRGGVTSHVGVDEWVPAAGSEVVSACGSVGLHISVGKTSPHC